MNATNTLHATVQRSRFLQHAADSLAGALPALFHLFKSEAEPVSGTSAVEAAVREAAAVRRMASTYASTEPSFAADLYAAADRHERMAGA